MIDALTRRHLQETIVSAMADYEFNRRVADNTDKLEQLRRMLSRRLESQNKVTEAFNLESLIAYRNNDQLEEAHFAELAEVSATCAQRWRDMLLMLETL